MSHFHQHLLVMDHSGVQTSATLSQAADSKEMEDEHLCMKGSV